MLSQFVRFLLLFLINALLRSLASWPFVLVVPESRRSSAWLAFTLSVVWRWWRRFYFIFCLLSAIKSFRSFRGIRKNEWDTSTWYQVPYTCTRLILSNFQKAFIEPVCNLGFLHLAVHTCFNFLSRLLWHNCRKPFFKLPVDIIMYYLTCSGNFSQKVPATSFRSVFCCWKGPPMLNV